MADEQRTKWTAIIVTCTDSVSVQVIQEELEIRQRKGFIDKDVLLLTTEDPNERVGSGGATVNALLVVTEHLSQQRGFTMVNTDVLKDSYILILHIGSVFSFDCGRRAFVTLPAKRRSNKTSYEGLVTIFDHVLNTVTDKLSVGCPPGVWISSTDMYLTVPSVPKIDWKEIEGVYLITVPTTQDYARNHGVCHINKEDIVEDIFFHGGPTALKMCALHDGIGDVTDAPVPLVAGIVFLSARAAEKFSSLHQLPGLTACTYIGLDSGVKQIELSLFFDILLCLAKDVSKEEFVSGEKGKPYNMARHQKEYEQETVRNIRARMWNKLRGIPMKAIVLQDASYHYMTISPREYHKYSLSCPVRLEEDKFFNWSNITHSYIEDKCEVQDTAVVTNSALEGHVTVGTKSSISHCHLQGNIVIPKDCVLSNIDCEASKTLQKHSLGDSILLQCFHLQLGGGFKTNCKVYTVLGRFDEQKKPAIKGTSTFCNSPWMVFLTRTGIDREDVWPTSQSDHDRTLSNAKLFPVWSLQEDVGIAVALWLEGGEQDPTMLAKWRSSWRLSLDDIMACMDLSAELAWRRERFFMNGHLKMKNVLLYGSTHTLLPFFKSAVVEGYAEKTLKCLDKDICRSNSPSIAARGFSFIANILGAMADGKGGLRSGPAGNAAWNDAFKLLEAGNIVDGVEALAEERRHWLTRPDRLIRAARHYEGADQVFIRLAVMSAKEYISTSPGQAPPMEKWVKATCPARMDVSGGWSDTPPITYEHGGAVVDAAIRLDGQKPIGAKAKRIAEPHIVLVLGMQSSRDIRIVCKDLSDLTDYTNPQSSGALLKAAIFCTEVITMETDATLEEQLMQRYGGGIELMTWSELPHGSGLGTSSILAGALLAVLWRVTGQAYDHSSLIHAVLLVEQMLTTGGGWQDQVGGLTAGLNVGHSEGKLPLRVDITPVPLSEEGQRMFNEHFLLVYTGKTRLARNMLQEVIRNWYARSEHLVTNCDNLTSNAWKCQQAFLEGDFQKVGACMNVYWEQKKVMAPGSEPRNVQRMMAALRPHVYGQCLSGAGGGGFMYVLTKEPNAIGHVREILADLEGLDDVTVHSVELDMKGIEIETED